VVAADSAPRSEPSGTTPSSSVTAKPRSRGKTAGKTRTASKNGTSTPVPDALGAAPDGEPTELEGADVELEGVPEVVDLEEVVDVELEAELATPEVVVDEEDDEDDDDEDEPAVGVVRSTGPRAARSAHPSEVR
jgi:hypothetical protein